ncbi:MAG: TolC family protein [bacterium]
MKFPAFAAAALAPAAVAGALALFLLAAPAVYAEDFAEPETTLSECIALALERNYDVKAKEEEIRGLELQAEGILLGVMPKLEVFAGAQYTTPVNTINFGGSSGDGEGGDDSGGETGGGFQAQDDIVKNWGAKIAGAYSFGVPDASDAVRFELAARKEELRILKDRVRQGVTQAYFAALLAQKGHEVAQDSKELADEQLRNAQLRYDNKVAPRFEVIQAEVQVSLAAEKLLQAENDKKNALKNLYLAMGMASGPQELLLSSKELDQIELVIAEIEHTEMPGFPEAFLDGAYQMHQFDLSMQSLDSQMRAARNWPVLSGFAQWQGQEGNNFAEDNTYTIGVNLNFRLFDFGDSKNNVERLQVQKNILAIKKDQFRQSYQNTLEKLSNDLEVAMLTYDTAKKTLEAATEGLKMATVGYKEGVTTTLELMDSRTQYLSAEYNLFAKKAAIYLAYDAIKQAIGYERYEEKAIVAAYVLPLEEAGLAKPADGEGAESDERADKKESFPVIH